MTEPFTFADKRKARVAMDAIAAASAAMYDHPDEDPNNAGFVPLSPEPPSWWPELGAIDEELVRCRKRWGIQHHDFGFGSKAWAVKADEERRINNRRHDAGNDSWLHIILEEVYEAFAESAEAEDKSLLYGELIQAAAMFVSAAEDLRSRG